MKKLTLLLFLLNLFVIAASAQFSWDPTNGPNGIYLNEYAQNSHTVFASGHGGLYRSFDGDNWEKVLNGRIFYGPMVHGDSILVKTYQPLPVGYSSVYDATFHLSQDNGNSWTTITPPSTESQFLTLCSSGLYMRLYNANSNNIMKSEDLGQTWAPMSTPTNDNLIYFLGETNDQILISSQNTIWQSDQNGENWATISLPPGVNSWDILFSGDNFFIPWHSYPQDSGYVSMDKGVSWQKAPMLIDGSADYSVIGSTIYSYNSGPGTTNHIFARSNDFGLSWDTIPVNYSATVHGVGRLPNKTFIQTYKGGIQEINETTGDVHTILSTLVEGGVDQVEQYGDEIWVGNSEGLFKYNINTQVWEIVTTEIANGYFRFFAKENNLVIAKFSDYNAENLWVSQDNGQTWTSKPIPVDDDFWAYIETAKIIDNTIFAFDSQCKLLKSTNFGDSWSSYNNATWGWECASSKIVKFKNKYYANVETILQASTNGSNWNTVADYPDGYIVDIMATDDYLFMQLTKHIDKNDCYLYKSKDGINWEWANDGLPRATQISSGYNSIYDYHGGRMFKQSDSTYFYNYLYGLYVSNDTCKTWYPVSRGVPNIMMTNNKVYAGQYVGLYSSPLPRFYGKLMKGTVFSDPNGNGIQDVGEIPLSDIKVSLKSPSNLANFYFITTKEDGSYVLGVTQNNVDTLAVSIQSDYITQIQPAYYMINDTNPIKNFAVQFEPNITDLTLAGNFGFRPRPGFDLDLSVFYKNKGTIPKDGKISITLSNNLEYLSAEPPAQVIGDSLVWDITDIQPLESGQLTIHTNIPASTPLNTPTEFHGYFIPTTGIDSDPSNNYFQSIDTIVGSFDPNDKSVSPAQGLTIDEIKSGKELVYTIRFQNTGNFYAEKVRITDQLDTALNLTTFRLIGASHKITELAMRPGGMLEFTFDNIMLLDSNTNEAASHGFVTFAIQRNKEYIDEWRPVKNIARIYFDYNQPIETNTVFSPIALPVDIQDIIKQSKEQLTIAPNPAIDEFTIQPSSLKGKGTISIWSVTGQLIKEVKVSRFSEPQTIQVPDLKPGVYLALARDAHQAAVGQVIIAGDK